MAISSRCLARICATTRSVRVNASCGYRAASSNNPAELTPVDIGRLYEVPVDTIKAIALNELMSRRFRKQVHTFDECVWLCRAQLLEAINCMRVGVSPDRPPLRIVFWGQFGTGKTLTLQQLVHYAYTQDYILLQDYEVMKWVRNPKELQASTYVPNRIDTPYYAGKVLNTFKKTNQHKWEHLSLKTERCYTWSKVESTAADLPITDIVDLGISAPYLATDCLGALCRELRRYATAGKIRLLIALDQGNSLYGTKTLARKANNNHLKVYAKPEELSQVQIFRRFLRNDWTNGACVLIADKTELSNARDKFTIPINTPMELFGEEGMDAIEPFIPIETKRYTMEEIDTLYDYYLEKEWLTSEGARTEQGRKQLAYLSAFIPYYYDRLCALY